MNRITYKYTVNHQLLEKIENYVAQKQPTLDELKIYFKRLKLFYQYGLSRIDK